MTNEEIIKALRVCGSPVDCPVTHWMPLPELPDSTKED